MRTGASALLCLLAACTVSEHLAINAAGPGKYKLERDRLIKLGGTASQKGADGSSIVTDDQQSLADVVVGLTTGLATREAGLSYRAAQQTDRVTEQQMTARAANAIPPAVTTPKVDAATGAVLTPKVTPAVTQIPPLPR